MRAVSCTPLVPKVARACVCCLGMIDAKKVRTRHAAFQIVAGVLDTSFTVGVAHSICIQLGRDWVCPKVEVEFEERPLGAVAC